MQIPRTVIDEYTAQLNTISESTKAIVKEILDGIEFDSIEDLQTKLSEFLEPILGASTDLAASYAASFYDEVRALSAGSAMGASVESCRNPKATKGFLDRIAWKARDGGIARIEETILGRSDYEIKKAAAECIYSNSENDPLKPRFARVPTGRETCTMCIMLASRGFVYHSSESAGSNDHYHANCDCRIVPGFAGMEVEGYDPEYYYRIWKRLDNAEVIHEDLYTLSKSKIINEAELYDSEIKRLWKLGKHQSHEYMNKEIDVLANAMSGVGNIALERNAKPQGKELQLFSWLANKGHDIYFIKPSDVKGDKTPDVLIDGVAWEAKRIETPVFKKIRTRIGEAANQSGNIIVDASISSVDKERLRFEVCDMLEDRRINQILLIINKKAILFRK